MGRSPVLLDDEGAGADAADGELLMSLDLGGLNLDLLHFTPRRSLPEELEQLVDGCLRPLGVDRDAAVLGVADPAEGAALAGAPDRRFAEADALNSAAQDRPNRFL